MSEIDDIRAFVAVVETGGFGRAGRNLGLSKSIVSRRVARLEADLGTHLLSRTTRGISATEAGLEFKARAERILADLGEAREAVARRTGGVSGRLRVSMPLTFGIRHVAPILGELASRYPELEIDAEASDRYVDLIGERFDLAIRIGELKDSSLVARRIAHVRTVVCGSPAYLARKGRPTSPLDLPMHDCLVYTGTSSAEWSFRMGKRWMSVRPPGRLRSDSGETLMQWASAGLGLAVLPTFIAGDAVRSGALEPVLRDHPMPEHGLHVVRPPGAYVPAKVRVFSDLLAERFAGRPDWDPCRIVLSEAEGHQAP